MVWFRYPSVAETVSVPLIDDDVDEGNDETFTLRLSARVDTDDYAAEATGTIIENDERRVVISNDALELINEVDPASYTVVLQSEPTGTVTVTPAVSGTHSEAIQVSPSSLTFTAGNWAAAQTVTVTPVDDDFGNPGKQRSATISHTVATTSDYRNETAGSVAVVVRDDDGDPTVFIRAVDHVVHPVNGQRFPGRNEGDAPANIALTVQVIPLSTETVTMRWTTAEDTGQSDPQKRATPGQDYTTASGALTFAPGGGAQTITVPVLDDQVDEFRQTFKVNLVDVQGACVPESCSATSTSTTVSVLDDDEQPFAILDTTDGLRAFLQTTRFNRAGVRQASERTVTVAWIATDDGTEYDSGTVDIRPPNTEARIEIDKSGLTEPVSLEVRMIRQRTLYARIGDYGSETLPEFITLTPGDEPPSAPRMAIADATVEENAGSIRFP